MKYREIILEEMSNLFNKEIIALPLGYKSRNIYKSHQVAIKSNAFLGNYTNNL